MAKSHNIISRIPIRQSLTRRPLTWCRKKLNGGGQTATSCTGAARLQPEESAIKAGFVEAFNQVLGDKDQYITRFEEMLPLLADTSGLEEQLAEAQNKHARLMDNLRRYMEENTRQIQDQEEYNHRFSELDAECKEAEQQITAIQKELLAQSGRKEQIRRCLDELRKCGDILEEFNLDLWNSMVESVTVYTDKKLAFLFRDGTKISIQTPEKAP